jgi:uncharacterized membrane protein
MTARHAQDSTPESVGGPEPAGTGLTRLTRVLGWASLGLGVAQMAAPGAVRRLSGVDDSATSRVMVPAVGARELVHAAGLLSGRRPALWAWTRVAGDAVDLGSLAVARANRGGERRRRVTAVTVAVAGIAALDVAAAVWATRRRVTSAGTATHLYASITVNRPADELYRFWRDFENLPSFMFHLESVAVTGERLSHWTAKAPAGRTVEWDAEIVDDRPGELIAWRSREGATVPNSGSVRLSPAPGDNGTEVRVEIDYDMPGGKLGTAVAKLFGEEPEQQVRDDLRRFKQVMETGEVARSAASPEGTSAARQLRQRPAQPQPAPNG